MLKRSKYWLLAILLFVFITTPSEAAFFPFSNFSLFSIPSSTNFEPLIKKQKKVPKELQKMEKKSFGISQRTENASINLPLKYQPKKLQIPHSALVPDKKLGTGKFVFFVAPHPDDAILCCATKIRETLQSGKKVKIIYLTNGDAKPGDFLAARSYGDQRRIESEKAMKSLGIETEHLFFLNFPDNYLMDIWEEKMVQSEFTGQKQTHQKAYKKNQRYHRNYLNIIIQNIFENFPPERIYFPDENYEQHPDHRAAGKIVLSLVENLNPNSDQKTGANVSTTNYNLADNPEIINGVEMLRYVVHSRVQSKKIPLNNEKLQLINYFLSQFHDIEHQNFMESFAQKEEKFY